MVDRVYLAPGVASISKPGYSASAPPAISYDYLSLHPSLPQSRPLEIGYIPNFWFPIPGQTPIYRAFALGPYANPPAVEVALANYDYSLGNIGNIGRRSIVADNFYTAGPARKTPYYVGVTASGFYLAQDGHDGWQTAALNIFYVAWNIR